MVGRYYGLWNFFKPTWNKQVVQNYYTNYLTDAGKLYKTLRDTYGYDEDNIFLLVKLLPEKFFSMPTNCFDPSWVDNQQNENLVTSLKNTLNSLKSLSEDASLLFCFVGHGGVYDDSNIDWISPDSHEEGDWTDEQNAYDDDKDTKAIFNKNSGEISSYLTLKLNEAEDVEGFRIRANSDGNFEKIRLEFCDDSTLKQSSELFDWDKQAWTYYRLNSCEKINTVKIQFYESDDGSSFDENPAEVYEFDLWPAEGPDDVIKTYFGCPIDWTLSDFSDFLKSIFGLGQLERLKDEDLKEYVKDVKAKKIFLLQPCHSGGFIDDLSADNHIVCTSARGYEKDAGWIGPFNRGLSKEENADVITNDGEATVLEAYMYAVDFVLKHSPHGSQHPLIDDDGDAEGHYYADASQVPSTGDGATARDLTLGETIFWVDAGGPYTIKKNTELKFYSRAEGGDPPYIYLWDFGDGHTSDKIYPKHTYSEVGAYTVTLTVTDESGVAISETAEVTVTKAKAVSRIMLFFQQILSKIQQFFSLFINA
jgi:hypothetical protein